MITELRLPIGDGWSDGDGLDDLRFVYTGQCWGRAPRGSTKDAQTAIAAAHAGREQAASLPSHQRATILKRALEQLRSDRGDVIELLVLESAKPIRDCRAEFERTALTIEIAAEEATRIHGETVPVDVTPSGDGMTAWWTRRPIGVVVGITGFNYPLLLAAHKAAPALAAGCPVILKPSPRTPTSALYLARILREAGAPPPMVQAVTGGADVGEALVSDPRVAAVSFTGSASVGQAIARAAWDKKVVLELGSNAALVVADDADLDAAARACVRGGFYASGQACISVQRVIVDRRVCDAFLERLVPLVAALRSGDPRDEATDVGPLIEHEAADRVVEWTREAVAAGARVAHGGGRDGPLVQPTIITELPETARTWDEEVFAPILAVRTARSYDEALDMVNASRYGLHASVYTNDLSKALAAADRLEVGGVLINEVPGFRADNMPYGGVKDSGFGREGPRFLIEELTVTKMVIVRPKAR